MRKATDERRIAEYLKSDSETELMPYDLNEMLEQELSKPETEVDGQLIREILELMETKDPSPKEKEECWNAVQSKVKKTVRRKSPLRWTCGIAAGLVVLFLISFETARAFNWTFLLKYLDPVAQAFGLYSMSNVDQQAAENPHAYTDEFTEYKQIDYHSLADMPAQLWGQSILPGWVPERFAFVNGTIYEDENMASASLYFGGEGDDTLSLILSFYKNEEDITSYVYEVSTADQNRMTVAGRALTYYFNDDGQIRAVSAIEEKAHFFIGGSISQEELDRIVASMN